MIAFFFYKWFMDGNQANYINFHVGRLVFTKNNVLNGLFWPEKNFLVSKMVWTIYHYNHQNPEPVIWFSFLCAWQIGAEAVVIRNLEHSLKAGPSPSADTSGAQNGTCQINSSSRKRAKVAVLISGTGVWTL